MSYLVLARKYRPKTFAEVAGQEVVTRTLRGAIAEHRIGHAYLFFGPRGTGKTTSARLFAKALNCDEGPIEEPCGVCERCQAFDAGAETDLIEIDAASNTGVDHVRGLRDQAAYVPLRARFKIFLVDEVHMLSKQAFNALLKTLEEPPPHVKFLFATTELHKVPDTIVSRCQVLRLTALPEETIAAKLDEIFALENVSPETGVSAELARRARGGMRDALSLADQLLALVGAAPTVADCERLAGEGSTLAIEAVIDRLVEGDRAAVLEALPAREGDEAAFLTALLDYLRGALLLRLVGEGAPMFTGSGGPEARAAMAARADRIGAKRLELWLQELLHARERMGPVHMQTHARVILEVTLLDLCHPEGAVDLATIAARLEELEARLGGAPTGAPAGVPSGAPRAPSRAATEEPPERELRPLPPPSAKSVTRQAEAAAAPGGAARFNSPTPATPPAKASEPDPGTRRTPTVARPRVQTNSTADAWGGFLAELDTKARGLCEIVRRRGKLVRYGGGAATVKFQGLTDDERVMVEDRRNGKSMSRAFSDALGSQVDVTVEVHSPSGAHKDDNFTKDVADLFGGRVED